MGKKLPLLKPKEVENNLIALGFVCKRQDGSHKQYERSADGVRPRMLVTVDVGKGQFGRDLMKRMIRQSGFTEDEFCSGELGEKNPSAARPSVKAN
jgi:predicted RNA binding protein YcfA (HicA-like mRNA interferase family)